MNPLYGVLITFILGLGTGRIVQKLNKQQLLFLIAVFWITIYTGVGLGFIVVTPPRKVLNQPKVFGIGLSRTGTTSLTVALKEYGYYAYHALPALVKVDSKYKKTRNKDYSLAELQTLWSDSFDALTDIQASVVFKDLAERYPDALFILTERDPQSWGSSMRNFCNEMGENLLRSQQLYDMGFFPQGADGLFVAMYGDWQNHSVEQWTQIYLEHQKLVTDYFNKEAKRLGKPSRLLQIDVTKSDELTAFHRLGAFLGKIKDDEHVSEKIFPKADVMKHMFSTQILWQLEYSYSYLYQALRI